MMKLILMQFDFQRYYQGLEYSLFPGSTFVATSLELENNYSSLRWLPSAMSVGSEMNAELNSEFGVGSTVCG